MWRRSDRPEESGWKQQRELAQQDKPEGHVDGITANRKDSVYRFKLEGQDRHWRAAVNELRVEYSNRSPGPDRFRVIACNNSGVWKEAGDSLEFSIDPAYY